MQSDSEEVTLRASLAALWQRSLGADAELTALSPAASYRPGVRFEPGVSPQAPCLAGLKLVGPVGEGGMGIVYEARQASLERKVAVKVVHPDALQRPEVRGDFLSEALVGGRLEHPNIVPVHDLCTDAAGQPALVMKLVEGSSWQQLLRERPDELDRHLDILLQVCNAVAFAHSRGIVHNDLKPANVMLGSFGEVLVMDWGLAAAFDAQPVGSRLRQTRAIDEPCGTPHYMPPELANGCGDQIGPWSDVYLLGALLYRILAGHAPHRQPSLIETLLAASLARWQPLPASVPAELRGICARAMAREPAKRFVSVPEFQQAVRGFLRHKQSLALSDEARDALKHCQAQAARPLRGAERNRLYRDFALVVAELRQALKLWPDNPEARQAAVEARVSYARVALSFGDLGLAESQAATLQEGTPPSIELQGLLGAARRRSLMQRRRRRLLQAGSSALVLVLLAGIALGLLWLYTKPVHWVLDTEPAGSEIWLNGERLEHRTPYTLPLTPGHYRLRLVRPPFQDIEHELSVAWGEAAGLAGGKLVHVPHFETWFFHSEPEGAQVDVLTLDGRLVRQLTSPASDTLSAGRYRVRFALDGFRDPAGETLITVVGSVQPRSLRHPLQDMLGEVVVQGARRFATAEVYGRGPAAASGSVLRQLADEPLRLQPGSWRLFVGGLGEMVSGLTVDVTARQTRRVVAESAPPRWLSRIPIDHHSSPLCLDLDQDGQLEVLLATTRGACCFDAGGALRWQVPMASVAWSHPLAVDVEGDGVPEVVFDRDNGLVCVDAAGRQVWEFEFPMAAMSGLAGLDLDGDGQVEVLAGGRSELACLSAAGELLWWQSLPGVPSAPPLGVPDLGQGRSAILIPCGDRLECLDRSGIPVWSVELPGEAWAAPAVADLDGDGRREILLGCDDGSVLCWDAAGEEHWRVELPGEIVASLTLGDLDGEPGLEIAAASDAGLFALDARGGLLWRMAHLDGFAAAPVLLDRTGLERELLAISEEGELVLVAGSSGEPLVRCRLQAWVDREPVVVDLEQDGQFEVVVADHEGVLQCLPLPGGRRWEAWSPDVLGVSAHADGGVELAAEGGAGQQYDASGQLLARWDAVPGVARAMRATRLPGDPAVWLYTLGGEEAVAVRAGELLWRAQAEGKCAAVLAGEPFCIILDGGGQLTGVERAGGQLWTHKLQLQSAGSSSFTGLDAEGGVHWFDAAGTPLLRLPADLRKTFVLPEAGSADAPALLALSDDGELAGFARDGAQLWRAAADPDLRGRVLVAVVPDTAAFSALLATETSLLRVDAAGARVWRQQTGRAEFPAQVADLDGDGAPEILLVCGQVLRAVDLDGRTLWTRHLLGASGVRQPPLLVDLDGDSTSEVLVVGTELNSQRSRLYCLEHDGGVRWSATTRAQQVWDVAVLPRSPERRAALVVADHFGLMCVEDRRPVRVLWSAERHRARGVQPPP